ncbi:hypothetical protein BTVI_88977 [Pitangus sulphuratus]|nr:hypothetical protein BTVI_88977 [Pitangus sulphuratus]
MADTRYMIVNEKAPLSRAMFGELQRHAPPGVPVLQPEPEDPDVWQVLGGDKDDFLVYDRCGRLAFHIQLPFSFLHFPYVESAIRFTHSKDFCGNCSLYPNTTQENALPSDCDKNQGGEKLFFVGMRAMGTEGSFSPVWESQPGSPVDY